MVSIRISRWSSEAFLEYIREQVEVFTFGVSNKMTLFEYFHTINTEQCQDEEYGDIIYKKQC